MLSHYRLVEKIGEGGMGVVWKALDTRLARPIALKLLPPELTADPERHRRFLREARTAAAVSHPNIVGIHEVGEADGLTFIAMELVEGRTLRSVIGGRPIPIPQALRIAIGIAEGLARAHREHIVHRDLKPENVIIAPDGHSRILDFGLAKVAEPRDDCERFGGSQDETRTGQLTREGALVGTPAYMSPEQARGEVADERSDIFAFGVTLYEMVTGRVPFQGRSRIETLAAVLQTSVVPASRVNATVPSRLEEILGKCLEKDATDRYQTTQDLVVDLQRLRRDLDSSVRPSYGEIAEIRTRAGRGRRPARIAGAVLLSGVVLIAAGGWLLVQRHARPGAAPASPIDRAHARSEIAVLPFQNLSAEGQQAYFAGGLHEELLTQLAKVSALKVISRTSVMGYRETTKPLRAIAEELGVGSVVEGSVQVVGERLRVNVQLIDAANDEHLWAEHYDRTLDDAFAIQSEVAQRIVTAVGAALTVPEQGRLTAAPTANTEAYRLYLQGEQYRVRPGAFRQDRESAQKLFEQAVALDPDFAPAHAALSQVHGSLYQLGYDRSEARAARQREEAATALRLAPDLPRAHFVMGLAYYQGRQDYPRALQEFTIALEGLPNDAEVWFWLGGTHRRLGNWDNVLKAFDRSTQLDPSNADVFFNLGGPTYGFLHRYAEAVRAYDRALSLAPNLHDAAIRRAWTIVAWRGDLDAVREALEQVPEDATLWAGGSVDGYRARLLFLERNADALLAMPAFPRGDAFRGEVGFQPATLYMGWAFQVRGDQARARAAFESARVRSDSELSRFPEDYRLHVARGLALAGLGRHEEALREADWLRQSVVYQEDAFGGPRVAEDRARILAQVGDAEGALDEIDRLLTAPSSLSGPLLRLDPVWDPIRDHPRFKALLAKYDAAAR